MALPKYITLSHLRKVILAFAQRFGAVEADITQIRSGDININCASTADIEEMCTTLGLTAVVVTPDDYEIEKSG